MNGSMEMPTPTPMDMGNMPNDTGSGMNMTDSPGMNMTDGDGMNMTDGHNPGGHGAGAGDHGAGHAMSPYLFIRSTGFFVLFQEAHVETTGGFVAALLASFVFALISTTASQLMRMHESKAILSGKFANQFLASLLHGFRLFLHYTLMLIVMTMNVWLILAVVGGTALGWLVYAVAFGRRFAALADVAQKAGADCEHD